MPPALNRKGRSPWRVSIVVRLAHIGRQVALDLSGLKEAGLVDPRSGKTNRLTEEFRRIKHPLIMHANGKGASVVANANMIMVTSSLAGEGKTFTSINLAMSIATEMDKTVLLVDADVAKPDVTARLGVQAEKRLDRCVAGRQPDPARCLDKNRYTQADAAPRRPQARAFNGNTGE